MDRIKTLLLSGENNHDWRRSTPFCKALLENSGKFEVEVTTTAVRHTRDYRIADGVPTYLHRL